MDNNFVDLDVNKDGEIDVSELEAVKAAKLAAEKAVKKAEKIAKKAEQALKEAEKAQEKAKKEAEKEAKRAEKEAKRARKEAKKEAERQKREAMKPAMMNRELSWIRFNERVLEEAETKSVPLCERLSFAAIYQSNLDEFFQVRVGKLMNRAKMEPEAGDSKSGMTAADQIRMICKEIGDAIPRRDALYESLMEELDAEGIRIVDFNKIKQEEQKKLRRYFEKEIAPLIGPSIVRKNQPFPFLKNKGIYAVAVLDSKTEGQQIGIIPCGTDVFPRLIPVKEGSGTYILSEELILHYLPDAFKGYTVKAKSLIRVTRNADIDPDALYSGGDYREFMADIMRQRNRLKPVRLELSRELEESIVSILCDAMKIDRSQIFFYHEPLDLSFVYQLRDIIQHKTELFYNKRIPQHSVQFDMKRPILDQIAESDKMLMYPYESINPFLEMLHQAASDETVTSIKMTLYRVAKQSKVIEYLIEAAENGKEVLVVMELKARFDEEANVYWSRQLEQAGCKVIYGLKGYKVHSKLCLITRKLNGNTQYITQIGTGNYNEKTSRIYTDLCLMTADNGIGKDANRVFQALLKEEFVEETEDLLVAPKILRKKVIELIDEQIEISRNGGRGFVGLKLNSMADTKIMEKLIEASMAGVEVQMIIRGVCCLVPGVPGLTDNVRVLSIVGRFLEHARIFIFGRPADINGEKMYIGSADLMKRNTSGRVEIAAPVKDEKRKKQIREYFIAQMRDNLQVREMLNDGTYLRAVPGDQDPMNSQEYFYEQAYRRAGEKLPEEING